MSTTCIPDSGIALATAAEGERLTMKCFGDRVVWVPWRRPGFQTRARHRGGRGGEPDGDRVCQYEADPDGLWVEIPGAECAYGAHSVSLSVEDSQALETKLAQTAGPERVQQLYVTDTPELDLAAVSGFGRLISLRVLRCGRVDISVVAKLPLELLHLHAHTADLSVLAGHATLRNLAAQGLDIPIDLRWLADIPNLEILDLSGSTLMAGAALATMPQLRELTLDHDQWAWLAHDSASPPPNLATATMTGASLAEAVDWANRLAPEDNATLRYTGELNSPG